MSDRNEDDIIEYLVNEHEPDDPEEIQKQQEAEFRKGDKAALIRELKRKGYNNREIKLYGPHVLEARENKGIEIVNKANSPKRRILGKPFPKGFRR